MIEFNMNYYVSVRLTDVGKAILRQKRDDMLNWYPGLDLPDPVKTDEDGWQRFQLWDLMNELGSQCSLGRKVPFETTIRIHPEAQAISTGTAETAKLAQGEACERGADRHAPDNSSHPHPEGSSH